METIFLNNVVLAFLLKKLFWIYSMTVFLSLKMPRKQVNMYLLKLYKVLLFHQHSCSS